jgi:hypothetical protein
LKEPWKKVAWRASLSISKKLSCTTVVSKGLQMAKNTTPEMNVDTVPDMWHYLRVFEWRTEHEAQRDIICSPRHFGLGHQPYRPSLKNIGYPSHARDPPWFLVKFRVGEFAYLKFFRRACIYPIHVETSSKARRTN